jgi:hypothetical protein
LLFADGAGAVLLTLLWVFCIFDAITADESRVRNLPKMLWLLIVIVIPDVGSLLWLVAGRPVGAARSLPYKGNQGIPPEYDRPGRAVAANPDDDAAFLDGLRRRAEEQRRKGSDEAPKPAEDDSDS